MSSGHMQVDQTRKHETDPLMLLPARTRSGATFRQVNSIKDHPSVPSFGLVWEEEEFPQPLKQNLSALKSAKQEDEDMEQSSFLENADASPLLSSSSSSSATPDPIGVACPSAEDANDNNTEMAPSVGEDTTGLETKPQPQPPQARKKRSHYREYSDEHIRRALENHVLYGMTKSNAARAAKMPPGTFRAMYARYLESRGERLKARPRGRKLVCRIDDDQACFLLDYIDRHPECTIKDIRESQGTETNLMRMPLDYARRWLRARARITFERFRCFTAENTVDELARLQFHQQRFQEIITTQSDFVPTDNVVFFAEVAYQINSRRLYMIDPNLSLPRTSRIGKLTPHMRLIIAVCRTGIIAVSLKCLAGFISPGEMEDFADCVLEALGSAEEKKSLYLGFNYLPDHVATPIFAKAEQAGHTPFIFPDNNDQPSKNAADHLLQQLLYIIDRRALDHEIRERIQDRMNAALQKITPQDCENCVLRAFPQ